MVNNSNKFKVSIKFDAIDCIFDLFFLTTLKETVRDAQIVSTYDTPESGFDALVQAITCSKEIGWRNPSRHIILLTTDDYPHIVCKLLSYYQI